MVIWLLFGEINVFVDMLLIYLEFILALFINNLLDCEIASILAQICFLKQVLDDML